MRKMRNNRSPRATSREGGSVIIIVMMFALVFMIVGLALFVMVRSSNNSTALERKDVKAFNVAEAGVDSAMAELRAAWPLSEPEAVVVDQADFRALYANTTEFPDPKTGEFISATTYDNTPDNPTTDVSKRIPYDSNGDDRMWVDAEADVDDARHRILVMVRRLKLPVEIPDVALVANTAGGNGQGLEVSVDPVYLSTGGSIPQGGATVAYTGKGTLNKDVSPGENIQVIPQQTNPFPNYVTAALLANLRELALNSLPASFFDDTNGASGAAGDFLRSANGPGSIVYLETSGPAYIEVGNTQIGTPERPVILVVDTKDSGQGIDWRGTADFYGIVIIVGDVLLRGTHYVHGCVLSEGCVENDGGPGVYYNGDVIRSANSQYTLSVAMVPNSWEEFTIPK